MVFHYLTFGVMFNNSLMRPRSLTVYHKSLLRTVCIYVGWCVFWEFFQPTVFEVPAHSRQGPEAMCGLAASPWLLSWAVVTDQDTASCTCRSRRPRWQFYLLCVSDSQKNSRLPFILGSCGLPCYILCVR